LDQSDFDLHTPVGDDPNQPARASREPRAKVPAHFAFT
jgi:hypothetical protein